MVAERGVTRLRSEAAEIATGVALETAITAAVATVMTRRRTRTLQVQRGMAEGNGPLANLWQFLPRGGGDAETRLHDEGLDDLRVEGGQA